jgi:hypothetical protein
MIIGRDKLLKKEIYPRVKNQKPFILVGQRGIGKSVLLTWAYEHYLGEKLHVSCRQMSYNATLREIAKTQGIEDWKKKKALELEIDIVRGLKIALFLDDLERATPKTLGFLTALNETWQIYISGVEPFREEAKRLLWGKNRIKVESVAEKDRRRLADVCIAETGSLVSAMQIVSESRGIPARAWAIARGESIREDAERVEGEEINIAPVLLIFVVGIVVLRYVGLGTNQIDLYVLGGIGMGAALFLRFFIFKASKK